MLTRCDARGHGMANTIEATADNHVLTLEQIAALARDASRPADTLMNVVALIASRFHTDVCSAYLLEPDRSNLVLAATLGLSPRCVGVLRMPLHEGLAGLVAEQVLPVAVDDVKTHPRFKYFKESGEEDYNSFLGVPVIDRGVLQGVLIVQTKDRRVFRDDEIRMLADAAAQVAPIVSEARTLDRFIGPAQERLWSLARNLWWSWDPECVALFRDLDPIRWRQLNQNPILLLSEIPLDELERRATALVLHSRINYCYRRQREYLFADRTWGATHAGVLRPRPVAYFSAEFGLHESLPIYSGGLGVLAGDHVKSASDLDIPLIGVGLFYSHGYFLQRLNMAGWQQEEYIRTDVNALPMQPAIGANGEPVVIEIHTRGGSISAKVWRVSVGRVDLLLLDSNVEGNAPEDRELTSRLYGGDARVRIRQELLLGVGGFRALKAMGITPGVLHLNEGHSGFAVFEAIRDRMDEEGIDFYAAASQIPREVIFTTHTPVPAGHDRFAADLIEEHLGPLREQLGISHENLMGFGRVHPTDNQETVLHDGARPQALPPCQCRLVAPRRGLARHVVGPLPRPLRRRGSHRPHHQRRPRRLLARAADAPPLRPPPQARLAVQQRRSQTWDEIEDRRRRRALGDPPLAQDPPPRLRPPPRPRAGRAPRRNPRRRSSGSAKSSRPTPSPSASPAASPPTSAPTSCSRIWSASPPWSTTPSAPCSSSSPARPIPHDEPGKRVLQQIAQMMRDSEFADKFVFVEDYDINVGRHLVQGVDVWLNNPRRPLEASGTSGQKVVLNGGLNLSVLDGWWAEAYDGLNGFAIGNGRTHSNMDVHDSPRRRRPLPRPPRRAHPALLQPRQGRPAPRLDQAHEAHHPHPRLALLRRTAWSWTTPSRATSPPPAAPPAKSAHPASNPTDAGVPIHRAPLRDECE